MTLPAQPVRKALRVPVVLATQFSKDNVPYGGIILNLSSDGAFLRSSRQFEVQDSLHFSFQLPNGKEIRTEASIIWTGLIEGSSKLPYGMGVYFKNLPAADENDLETFVTTLL